MDIVTDYQPESTIIDVDLPDMSGTRDSKIRRSFTRRNRLIEIGASHSPIIPKSDGWHTTIIDHTTKEDLKKKYANEVNVDRIEDVDYIWTTGHISDVIPEELHGSFDGLIASHVGEHMPDFVRFLQSADKLLNPSGAISLALPDKRYCFDFFQSLTNTGDLIAAYSQKRIRHDRRTAFNQTAYRVHDNDRLGWNIGSHPNLILQHNLVDAIKEFNGTDPNADYVDYHVWYFTPSSFELILLELQFLGLNPWSVEISRAEGVEFYAWLTRKPIDLENFQQRRLELLKRIVLEQQEAIDLISEKIVEPVQSENYLTESSIGTLTISAVIPIYNGAKYIKDAIDSVLQQTLPVKELIIVDDGSTDNSCEIVEKLIAEYSTRNIQLFSQINSGQSSARNLGVSKATGDLIAFLDQDDMWYNNHLELLIEPFLEKSNRRLGWVYSNLDEVNESGQMIARSFLSTMATSHPKPDIFAFIREDVFILPSASLISKEAFDIIGGFDTMLSGYEDDDLFLRMFQSGYEHRYIDMPLSKWRIHTTSSSYTGRMAKSRNIYMRKLIDMFPDDVKRSRYYRRDLIAPRFYPPLMGNLLAAAKARDRNAVTYNITELNHVIQYSPLTKKKMIMKLTLVILSRPLLADLAWHIRKPFRFIMIRFVR